jgi:hypothetical protein
LNTAPAIGTYLIPVQRFRVCYALQVLDVIDCTDSHAPGIKQLHCKRWGLNDQRQPFDDGHTGPCNDGWYTGTFRPVGTMAWRVWDHPVNWHDQIYFKQIPAPIAAGQLELF